VPTLIKASEPGWEKHFPTEDEARHELLRHICKACLMGGDWTDFDENGICTDIEVTGPAPDQNNIDALLATACGCEFWFGR
jgi:hypothetical protein